MAKRNYNRAKPTDKQCGPFPRHFGRGANIRFVTPAGVVVQSNPAAYKALPHREKTDLCASMLAVC